MNRKLIAHIGLMLVGYGLAGMAALIPIEISELVQAPAKMADPVRRLAMFGQGVVGILAFASPIWAVSVLICEASSVTRLRWYAAAGAAAALFPLLLFGVMDRMVTQYPWKLLTLTCAGMAGGAVYWAVAGRKAGLWKTSTP